MEPTGITVTQDALYENRWWTATDGELWLFTDPTLADALANIELALEHDYAIPDGGYGALSGTSTLLPEERGMVAARCDFWE